GRRKHWAQRPARGTTQRLRCRIALTWRARGIRHRTLRERRRVFHEMNEPVVVAARAAARANERNLCWRTKASTFLAIQRHDDLAVAPLLKLVGAGIPNRHVARAVLTRGN